MPRLNLFYDEPDIPAESRVLQSAQCGLTLVLVEELLPQMAFMILIMHVTVCVFSYPLLELENRPVASQLASLFGVLFVRRRTHAAAVIY